MWREAYFESFLAKLKPSLRVSASEPLMKQCLFALITILSTGTLPAAAIEVATLPALVAAIE